MRILSRIKWWIFWKNFSQNRGKLESIWRKYGHFSEATRWDTEFEFFFCNFRYFIMHQLWIISKCWIINSLFKTMLESSSILFSFGQGQMKNWVVQMLNQFETNSFVSQFFQNIFLNQKIDQKVASSVFAFMKNEFLNTIR